jgi:hypothetical protein
VFDNKGLLLAHYRTHKRNRWWYVYSTTDIWIMYGLS